jgi:hypothetical protein
LNLRERRTADEGNHGPASGVEPAEDVIVCNLMQALTRLHDDLDRVELWTAALGCFLRPVPDYKPGDEHVLPTSPPPRHRTRRKS